MTTYIALLRGVNVGGHNKVPMAALRTSLETAGFTNVRTYIQSGNVLVDAPRTTAAKVSARVHDVIVDSCNVDVTVITLDATHLARVIADNPYAHEADPKKVHAILLPAPLPDVAAERLAAIAESFATKGSADTFTVNGTTVYLHTPGGFGVSDLAKALTTKGRLLDGTARNWATMTTLLEMART